VAEVQSATAESALKVQFDTAVTAVGVGTSAELQSEAAVGAGSCTPAAVSESAYNSKHSAEVGRSFLLASYVREHRRPNVNALQPHSEEKMPRKPTKTKISAEPFFFICISHHCSIIDVPEYCQM
jgi:hypothetical protein